MKCSTCYREHPPAGWGWTLYDKPVYWALPDDGASFQCRDCGQDKSHKDVILTQITCGSREVICKDCIDANWLDMAQNLGTYKD